MQQYSMPMMSGSRHCRTFARRKQSAASALTQKHAKNTVVNCTAGRY